MHWHYRLRCANAKYKYLFVVVMFNFSLFSLFFSAMHGICMRYLLQEPDHFQKHALSVLSQLICSHILLLLLLLLYHSLPPSLLCLSAMLNGLSLFSLHLSLCASLLPSMSVCLAILLSLYFPLSCTISLYLSLPSLYLSLPLYLSFPLSIPPHSLYLYFLIF